MSDAIKTEANKPVIRRLFGIHSAIYEPIPNEQSHTINIIRINPCTDKVITSAYALVMLHHP